MVLGYQGIRQFNKIREKAIRNLVEAQKALPEGQRPTQILNVGDYFHDCHQVLPAVLDWHNVLRKALRGTDTVTRRVLDLIDEKMLIGNAKSRIKAEQICEELKEILKEGKAAPSIAVPENIKELLREVDDDATSYTRSRETTSQTTISTFVPQNKTIAEVRKSKFRGPQLLKTANRSQVLRSVVVRQDKVPLLPEIPIRYKSTDTKKPSQSQQSSAGEVAATTLQETHQTSAYDDKDRKVASKAPFQRPTSNPLVTSPIRHKPPRRPATSGRQNVFQAREEIERREEGNILHRTRKDQLLSRHFGDGNRDIKFLVDNAETMKPFWYEAQFLVQTLLMKAKGQDTNGMDLLFTLGGVKVEGKEAKMPQKTHLKGDPFMEAMKHREAKPTSGHTDITVPLGKLFDKYLTEAKRRTQFGHEVRNMTLIVLTDGIWAGTQNKEDVKNLIVTFVLELRNIIGKLKKRPVSIEFIQFGDDEDATHRLWLLDNHLKYDGIEDIIDTEHSTGDINKMLLGSFIPEYDEDEDDDDVALASSPNQSQQSAESIERVSKMHSEISMSLPLRATVSRSPSQTRRIIEGNRYSTNSPL